MVPQREIASAASHAAELGARFESIDNHILEDSAFRANPVERCLLCRDALYGVLAGDVMRRFDLDVLVSGDNADDVAMPDRFGHVSARKVGMKMPLAEIGASKADVRAMAAVLGLSTATKPSAPCLVTRIPHGQPLLIEKVRSIGVIEDLLYELGVSDCRARHHGDTVRLELPVVDFSLVTGDEASRRITEASANLGYRYVTLDLVGMRSGEFTRSQLV